MGLGVGGLGCFSGLGRWGGGTPNLARSPPLPFLTATTLAPPPAGGWGRRRGRAARSCWRWRAPTPWRLDPLHPAASHEDWFDQWANEGGRRGDALAVTPSRFRNRVRSLTSGQMKGGGGSTPFKRRSNGGRMADTGVTQVLAHDPEIAIPLGPAAAAYLPVSGHVRPQFDHQRFDRSLTAV